MLDAIRTVPSLAPRAAEAIDPRVPIPSAPSLGTVDPALEKRLAELLSQCAPAIKLSIESSDAERRVAAAGNSDSESGSRRSKQSPP